MSKLDALFALCVFLSFLCTSLSLWLTFAGSELKAARKEMKHLRDDVAFYQDKTKKLEQLADDALAKAKLLQAELDANAGR